MKYADIVIDETGLSTRKVAESVMNAVFGEENGN